MEQREDELMHYGVLGMKWGVHRALRSYGSATTDAQKSKATNSLNKHKTKINNKLSSLDAKGVKLQKRAERNDIKTKSKTAYLEQQASKYRLKSELARSPKKSQTYRRKAAQLDVKANSLKRAMAKTEAKIAKNEKLKRIFNENLSAIDKALIDNGKKYFS